MCCIEHRHTTFHLNEVKPTENEDEVRIKGKIVHVKTWNEYFVLTLQRIELLEKIAEVVDETFHLLRNIFKAYTSFEIFQFLQDLHESAHQIEHTLHAFCVLNNFNQIYKNKYVVYLNHRIDYLATASKVFHTVSNFFATIELFNELKLISVGSFTSVLKIRNLLSSIGFFTKMIALIWNQKEEYFISDVIINGAGALWEGLNSIKKLKILSEYNPYITKIAAFAGIIHAFTTTWRLMPEYEQTIEFKVNLSKKKKTCC